MKKQEEVKVDTHKKLILAALYLGAFSIFFSGVFFTTFALIQNLSFTVLGNSMPCFVLGVLVAYLGVKYLLGLRGFEKEFMKETAVFSWKNLQRKKNHKLNGKGM